MPDDPEEDAPMLNSENSAPEAVLVRTTVVRFGAHQDVRDTSSITSIADVEALRVARGWFISDLCKVSDFAHQHYRRILSGERTTTEAALARLIQGLRILERREQSESQPVPRIIEMGAEYDVIAAGMKRRRMELGLTVEQVDYLAGFTAGQTSKLENWETSNGRGFGEVSAKLWCGALGVSLAVVEGPIPMATMRMCNPITSKELEKRYNSNRVRLENKRRTQAWKKSQKR